MKHASKLLLLTLTLPLLHGCLGGSKKSSLAPAANVIVKGSNASAKLHSLTAAGAGTPSSFEAVVTKLWLSKNADCSDAKLVGDVSSNPKYADFANNPTLLTGLVPAGTYHCMIFQMYDTILFKTPATISGVHPACDPNETYGMDIFRDFNETWYNYDTDLAEDGLGDGDEAVVNALQTYAELAAYTGRQLTSTFASTGGGAAIKLAYPDFHSDGANYHQLLPLSGPIVVPASGATEITLSWDFTNGLSGDGGVCWVEEAALSVEL